jgi:integrase
MRRGEILGLRRLDFDLEGSRVMLPQTKNGDGAHCLLERRGKDRP